MSDTLTCRRCRTPYLATFEGAPNEFSRLCAICYEMAEIERVKLRQIAVSRDNASTDDYEAQLADLRASVASAQAAWLKAKDELSAARGLLREACDMIEAHYTSGWEREARALLSLAQEQRHDRP